MSVSSTTATNVGAITTTVGGPPRDAKAAASALSLNMYDAIRSPENAIQSLGKAIALSQLFGCANVQQGEILAWECIAQKLPPFSLRRKYHLFFNQLTQKADDMLAEFHRLGGTSKIIERSATVASVELTRNGNTGKFTLTWADCEKEPFVYQTGKDAQQSGKVTKESDIIDMLEKGQKPKLKTKYRTPRSRMQMLWARVISDAIRAVAPEVNGGAYAPEEIDNTNEGVALDTESDQTVIDADFTVVDQTPAVVVAADEPAKEPAKESAAVVDEDSGEPLVSSMGVQSINEMLHRLGMTEQDQRTAAVQKKYGVERIALLTEAQGKELIESLRGKIAKKQEEEKAAKLAADSQREAERAKHDVPGASIDKTGPCCQVQIDEAKSLLRELEQVKPGASAKLKKALNAHGMEKIADLSVDAADDLIGKLRLKNLDAFIESTLTVHEDVPF